MHRLPPGARLNWLEMYPCAVTAAPMPAGFDRFTGKSFEAGRKIEQIHLEKRFMHLDAADS